MAQRLVLLVEAVNYCQRVRRLGMPASCYTKALREPIHFLWERRLGSKRRAAQYRSVAAGEKLPSSVGLVYDHAVPLVYLQEQLLELSRPTADSVKAVLESSSGAVWITQEEDRRLAAAGFQRSMPPDWDGVDPFARYRAVGIEVPNEAHHTRQHG